MVVVVVSRSDDVAVGTRASTGDGTPPGALGGAREVR
jgi:hypothetical protein